MKYILLLFISFNASAACYYMPDLNDASVYKIECRSKASGTEVCTVPGDWNVKDVKVEIREPGMLFDSFRDWSKGDVLAADESIVCSIDTDKKDERIAVEEAKVKAEKDKADAKKANWDTFCVSPKAGLETLICQDKGY